MDKWSTKASRGPFSATESLGYRVLERLRSTNRETLHVRREHEQARLLPEEALASDHRKAIRKEAQKGEIGFRNKFLKPIFEWVQANSPGSTIIPYCGAFEEELQDMETDADREKQLKEDGHWP